MRKNVLIVTEEWAGSGHYMAAVALQQALLEEACEVRVIGGLGVASPLLRKLSRSTYYSSLAHFPGMWDHLYNRDVSAVSRVLQKPLAKLLGKRLLERVIEQQKPDVIVSTHAYCLSALAEAKKKASRPFLLLGVLTDFHIHPYWLHQEIDYYSVAHPKLAEQMSEMRQIGADRVRALGIPLRQSFQGNPLRSKQDWKRHAGIDPERFMVLICGGTDGYGDMADVAERLSQLAHPLTIVVVTGKNAQLQKQLQQRFGDVRSPHVLHVFGYVDAMWEWLGAADAVVTKAGGLTCSEALAMSTPLILYQPLPGQERQNTRFLVEQGAAWEAQSSEDVAAILARLLASEAEYRAVVERMEPLGRPDSAKQIAQWLQTLSADNKQTYYSETGNIYR